ncbi:MAG TPA: hypothetical protein VN799_06635 [Acidimicrobiales bacterium]|nr:hypothetical protein [Acidimicrobiales bacterium]
MPSTGGNSGGCDNCGGPGDDRHEVRRIYLTLDADGRVAGSETMEATESWCLTCRTLYPHEACPPEPDGSP